jgi:hypothetical protein
VAEACQRISATGRPRAALGRTAGAQRRHNPLVPWLQHQDTLALGQHNTCKCNHLLAAHRIADDGEGVLTNLIIRVRAFEITLVDLLARNK